MTITITNTDDKVSYTQKAGEAFSSVAALLSKHCGPYAQHAVIPKPITGRSGKLQSEAIDEFTKDGITIVRALVTEKDQVFSHALRTVKYVGERVDNACHDGTTTAMMFFAKVAANLLASKELAVLPPKVVSDAVSSVIGAAMDRIDTDTVTLAKLLEDAPDDFVGDISTLAKNIAYHQALIASKGDTEIATNVSEVIASLPVELYGMYTIATSRRETKARMELNRQEGTFVVHAHNEFINTYNKALGTQLEHDDAEILITEDQLVEGNPEVQWLIQYISQRMAMTGDEAAALRPLFIISGMSGHSGLLDAMQKHNTIHPHARAHSITLAEGGVMTTPMYLRAIRIVAGKPRISAMLTQDTEQCIIRGARVVHKYGRLHLSGLYPATSGAFHPGYVDPNWSEEYTALLKELLTFITETKNAHDVDAAADDKITHAIKIYRQAACQQITDLLLCGTTHEIIADHSVVSDSFGAAVSSLEHGFVFGGYMRMFGQCYSDYIATENSATDRQELGPYAEMLVSQCIQHALIDVIATSYAGDINSTREVTRMCKSAMSTVCGGLYSHMVVRIPHRANVEETALRHRVVLCQKKDVFNALGGSSTSQHRLQSILIQPAAGFKEQLRRMYELLPKIATTTVFINPFREG